MRAGEERILVFDVGTSSVKTALFSAELELLARMTTEYPLRTAGGVVEARPEDYLTAMAKGVAGLPEREGIAAIAVTTQGETLVLTDGDGNPLRDAVVWLDARADKQAERLKDRVSEEHFYHVTGLPAITGALPICKLMWFRENQSAVYRQAAHCLLLEDYLRMRLTGGAYSTDSLATSAGWLNIRTGAYWDEILAAAEISEELLPPLLPSGTECGALLPEAAAGLGLNKGIPVFTGAMDQTAAALAAIAGRERVVAETVGSAHVVAAVTSNPDFSQRHRLTVYRHAIDGQYLYLPIGNTAGMALKWFRREFSQPGEDYEALDELAGAVPPGCGGVSFLPFLSGSVDPMNLPEASACFFGLTLSSTRGHMARAVMEAAGYELRQFFLLLEQRGVPAGRVVSLGGGALSGLWCGIRSDISGKNLEIPILTEAAAGGAALLALWGMGRLPRGIYPQALTAKRRGYAPQSEGQREYAEGFVRYETLCGALAQTGLWGRG